MMNLKSDELRKAAVEHPMYALLGAGQVLFETARDVYDKVTVIARDPSTTLSKGYEDLAQRGQRIVLSIRSSAYTRRAVQQTKSARTQVKAAATSVRKAAVSGATATKAASRKVG